MRHRILLPLLALLATACSSGTDKVSSAWKEAGLAPADFKEVGEKLPGGKCSTGKVSGLDVTLCEFNDAEAATKAEDAGLALVGSAVGSSLAAGKLVLVVADTRKEDPSGRRVNDVINIFRKKMR
jgi:hypothetical protein